jgi:hypothetical protein
MLWILGFAVLVAFPLAAAGYSSYRRDLIAARARARSGSRMVTTAVVRSSTPEWVKGHSSTEPAAGGTKAWHVPEISSDMAFR